jgi:hypothetical protein
LRVLRLESAGLPSSLLDKLKAGTVLRKAAIAYDIIVSSVAQLAQCGPPLQAVSCIMAALVAALLPTAAAQASTPAAVDTLPVNCSAALWHGLPLAKQHTPPEAFHPGSREYYQEWTLKHVLPPFFCCIATAALLAFLIWRALRLATCVRCLQGPRLRGKPALAQLSGRSVRWARFAVPLLALAVAGSAGFAFSTIQPSIEPTAVAVFEETMVGDACRNCLE